MMWPDFWVILPNTLKFNSFLSIFSDFARLAHPCTFSSFQGYWLLLLPSSSCSIFKHCLHWLMVELSSTSNKLATNHTGDYIEQLTWVRAGNLIHPEVGAGPYITYSLLGFYNRHLKHGLDCFETRLSLRFKNPSISSSFCGRYLILCSS